MEIEPDRLTLSKEMTEEELNVTVDELVCSYLNQSIDWDDPWAGDARLAAKSHRVKASSPKLRKRMLLRLEDYKTKWQLACRETNFAKDSFDTLHDEGGRMMSIGLHCRLVGRPGRIMALRRFLDYVRSHPDVWFARRIDIARHWHRHHPPQPMTRPSEMTRDAFVDAYGGIFEHSPWIAERAHALELGPAHDSAIGLHNALCRMFRSASQDEIPQTVACTSCTPASVRRSSSP